MAFHLLISALGCLPSTCSQMKTRKYIWCQLWISKARLWRMNDSTLEICWLYIPSACSVLSIHKILTFSYDSLAKAHLSMFSKVMSFIHDIKHRQWQSWKNKQNCIWSSVFLQVRRLSMVPHGVSTMSQSLWCDWDILNWLRLALHILLPKSAGHAPIT